MKFLSDILLRVGGVGDCVDAFSDCIDMILRVG